MAKQQAVPEAESDKKQGDKLEHVLDSVADKGTGPTQDTLHKGSGPAPQDGSLK